MAIVVTSKGTNTASGSLTVTISGLTVIAGSTLIACCGAFVYDRVSCVYNDGADDYPMTLRCDEGGGNYHSYIYSLDNVAAASGSGTVTFTVDNAGQNCQITLYQATGLDSAGSFDKSASAVDRDTSFDSGNTATLSQADELIVGTVYYADETATVDSWDGTVTDNIQTDNDADQAAIASAVKIVSSTAACNCAGTLSAKEYYGAAVATFKAASAPSGWTGKILGVDSANIAKICGVAIADIARVGGV